MNTYEIKVLKTVKEPSGLLKRTWEVSKTFKSYQLMNNKYNKLIREHKNNIGIFVNGMPLSFFIDGKLHNPCIVDVPGESEHVK